MDAEAVEIACGHSHLMAISAQGDLWGFGHAAHGQLGRALAECANHAIKVSDSVIVVVGECVSE